MNINQSRSTLNLQKINHILEEINESAIITAMTLKQQGEQIKRMNQKASGELQSQLVQSSSKIKKLETSSFINKLLWPF